MLGKAQGLPLYVDLFTSDCTCPFFVQITFNAVCVVGDRELIQFIFPADAPTNPCLSHPMFSKYTYVARQRRSPLLWQKQPGYNRL